MASNLFVAVVVSIVLAVVVKTSTGTIHFKSKEQLALQLSTTFLGRTSQRQPADRPHRFKRQLSQHNTSPSSRQYNVIYAIDSSSSISNVDFKIALKAIDYMILKARPDTRYAAVLFSSYAQVVSEFTSPAEIMRRLKAVERLRGGTNFYDALRACSDLFNNISSGRNTKGLNRILIITDGLCNIKRSKTLTEALQLKLNGTEIFVVAVGHHATYGMPEISFVASSMETHVFRVKTMKGLFDVARWIPYQFDTADYENGYYNNGRR